MKQGFTVRQGTHDGRREILPELRAFIDQVMSDARTERRDGAKTA